MPHSPYTQIVYPPIKDLASYEQDLRSHRAQYDNDEEDYDAIYNLLNIGDDLLEQCKFLEEKLNMKV